MLKRIFQMSLLRSLALDMFIICILLVFLILGYIAAEPEYGANAQEPRKSYVELNNDAHMAECCKRHPPQEAGLKCCGEKPTDPFTDTCCKTGSEQTLKGPTKRSRRSAQTQCGKVSYNETTQLCCGPATNKTVHDRTSDHHRCCGNEQFDSRNQSCCYTNDRLEILNDTTHLCCGPENNKTVLTRTSDHHYCCGNEQYNITNQSCCHVKGSLVILNKNEQLCCGPDYDKRVVNKTSEQHRCCGNERFDDRNQSCCYTNNRLGILNDTTDLCCGPEHNKTVLTRTSDHHYCCGNEQYNNRTHYCCHVKGSLEILNTTTHLCCGPDYDKRVLTRTSDHHHCCGNEQYNNRSQSCCHVKGSLVILNDSKQLCCGPEDNKTVLNRTSEHHHCCGNKTFDNTTHCCCHMEDGLQIQNKDINCCKNETAGKRCKRSTEERRGNETFDEKTHLSCRLSGNRRVLKRAPEHHRCCGVEQQIRVHSSVNETHKHLCRSSRHNKRCRRGRKERKLCWSCCSGRCRAVPNMCNWAGCVSKRKPWMNQCHGSPGHHCCVRETFRPREVCCGGRRHERVHCCGLCSYNVEHAHVKCCSGTLFNLTSLGTNAQDAQCCGSVLLLSEGGLITADQKFYFPRTRLRCCRRRYYNPAVCSCCAGRLHPIKFMEHHQCKNIQDFRFLSVNSLNEDELCGGIHIGTVERVSLHSVVFTNVLKIHGSNGTVTLGSLNHTVPIPAGCSSPMLTPGTACFFNETNVFVDSNHRSVLPSLHFIFSKCFHP